MLTGETEKLTHSASQLPLLLEAHLMEFAFFTWPMGLVLDRFLRTQLPSIQCEHRHFSDSFGFYGL